MIFLRSWQVFVARFAKLYVADGKTRPPGLAPAFRENQVLKSFFEHIKRLQSYELPRRCNPLPLMLTSPLTYAVTLGLIIINVLWGVLVLLNLWQYSANLKETENLGATENELWIGNFNVKAWKNTDHKLRKIWRSLKFRKISGKRAHPWCWNGLLTIFTFGTFYRQNKVDQ